ncbi:hypothetical protein AQS8620_01283 [Aquimixticola soesokkakensis]|uniref:Uncharacterized protein n=1 Tax=Aquimixticola soesokkakensis TaxID=1519096 RepID=A0A1Y5SCJ4_9RHOB|nr:hypothetical protein [Aquimixticola soesokkakensis]SLN36092.1 hypothetical protein AQS8620_01283 [Aquimixticola soesokkakensis]
MKTSERLAGELRKAAAKANQQNATTYEKLAVRALTGEFDDYGTVHLCGPTALHEALMAAGLTKFAARVANGEFDATEEESDEWANSAEGREAMKDFTSEQRAVLFGVYNG